jgi:hypothetical protein
MPLRGTDDENDDTTTRRRAFRRAITKRHKEHEDHQGNRPLSKVLPVDGDAGHGRR